MIKNTQSLKDHCKNYSRENNVEVQQVLQNYMFERFLDRLAHSQYKEHFIIKGGALLSNIMGLDMRTTRDIDGDVINMIFNQENIEIMIHQIINIDLHDYSLLNIKIYPLLKRIINMEDIDLNY